MKIIEKNLGKITPEVKKNADFLDTTNWVSPLYLENDKVKFSYKMSAKKPRELAPWMNRTFLL